MQDNSASNKTLIAGIIAVTVLIFGGLAAAIYLAPSDTSTGVVDEQVSFDDTQSPSVGPADAKVVVRMYSDFQCPACRAAEAGVKVAMQRYADRVRFVWKDFPLTTIHRNARPAANAARCAEEQNQFWAYQTKLYDLQPSWENLSNPKDTFIQYARELNLNVDAFTGCVNNTTHDAKVQAGISEGMRNRVNSTPTVFVNNRRYNGMTPAMWIQVLDQALAENVVASSTVPVVTSTNP